MHKPEYTKLLLPAERLSCIKMGVAAQLARRGISLSDMGSLKKSAFPNLSGIPANLFKAVMIAAAVGAIPLAVAGHVIGRLGQSSKNKQFGTREKIKYYQEAAKGIEAGLAKPKLKEEEEDASRIE